MMRPRVKIEYVAGGGTTVWLDGVEVKGLVNVVVEHHVLDEIRVALFVLPSEVEIAADFEGEVETYDATSHPHVRGLGGGPFVQKWAQRPVRSAAEDEIARLKAALRPNPGA